MALLIDGTRSLFARRRSAALILAAIAHPLILTTRADAAPPKAPAVAISRVERIGMTVADLDRSIAFFTDVLTFQEASRFDSSDSRERPDRISDARTRMARLRLGDEEIELTEYVSPKGRPFPADSRSNDRWFQHIAIIVSDMDRAHAWLHDKMVRHASKDPQTLPAWNKNAAGIKAFYFRDPDGHYLEILQFPPDKGNPKWRRKTDRLFLGIDHTAIVVADTDASLRFYRDMLGMTVVGRSENYGVEQADLNHVPGAHLRITTLRPAEGPAIEFLEYLHPRDGRLYPADARPNDILHWQTTLVTRDAQAALKALRSRHERLISQDVADVSDAKLGFRRALLVRDPDGHAMQIVEK